jgi:hypothetical protein
MDYFELYYAYLAWCEKDNWANMRDPNHDYMEWNHTLPQCIFGDLPIGQWLTIEQHAVASALQTLAFNWDLLCGWHWKHLPNTLKREAKKKYGEVRSRRRTGENNHQYGKPHTQTTRDKISETLKNGSADGFNRKGKNHPMWGKSHKLESRQKTSESLKGSKNPNYGKEMSNEQKAKISLAKQKQFRCLVTGTVSGSSGLTKIQNRLGIDTSLREQIN